MGRSSLIMVMGFSMALLLKGFNLSAVSSDAYNNVVNYYTRAASHNIAAGVANMGCNVIYRVPNAFPKWTGLAFGGGTVNLWTKTEDSLGRIRLTAASNYKGYLDTVSIVWGQSNFSKFAYYSQIEGAINWAGKDTIFGPFHTQDKMTVNGGTPPIANPVFWGKVTNKLGMTKSPATTTPEFHNGYQSGIDIPMPTDFAPLKNAAISGGKYIHGSDVTIAFDSASTGYMTIKIGAAAATRVLISTYCPNGALLIDSGNVRIKGKFKGQLTLSVQSGGKAGKGKMYLDSSVAYCRNPLDHPNPPDLLGLCAEDSIVITNNANNANDVTIQGALFSLKGGLGVEQYNNGDIRGRINLLGGISQKQRAAVGTLSGGVVNSGFSKSYRYDDRMMNRNPPFYPTTGSYEILSWYER
ncbi:MAG: hypothetical protein NTU47_14765 [Ignavibacteriales bacterium]|nr:hypothetical protein [Ignavibacteriales bacterium]